jgi:hypothetical protein
VRILIIDLPKTANLQLVFFVADNCQAVKKKDGGQFGHLSFLPYKIRTDFQ